MKEKIGMRWQALIIIIFFFFGSGIYTVHASADLPHRVFILHSYEANHVCGQPQHDGIVTALKREGFKENKNLVLQVYFMDTKRKNNTPELIKEQARLALEKIRSFRPNVLVTLDDNAFSTVALNLVDSAIPIVFSGMNGQPEDYNKIKPFMDSRSLPGHNITGVYEKLHIVDAIKVHSRLFPGLKKIRIFVDQSPTGKAITKQIEIELGRESIPCSWDMKIMESWEEYQEEIHSLNRDSEVGAVYPAALLLKDRKGATYTAPEIFAWTVRNSRKPEIAINYAFTRLGLFGGAAVDFYAMGLQAGRMVTQCLRGENPGGMAIEEADKYALVFNLKRAEQLGIKIPPDILMAADEVITGAK
jgi:putative ABC transport system substrate-binding protein